MRSLFLHELRIRRGTVLGWSIGLGIYAALYTAFYPALPAEMLALDYENIDLFQAFGDMSMSSFEAYMGSSVFNFLAVLLGIFAVMAGVGTLAGEEENGTLEGLISLPIARWRLVTAKALALAAAALMILLVTGLVIAAVFTAIRSQIDSSAGVFDLLGMTLMIWPVAMVLLMTSLFLGALLPSRRAASAAAVTLLVVSYFGNNLADMFEALRPLQLVSPFNYLDTGPKALTAPVPWGSIVTLLAGASILLLLAIWSFGQRDLTVGSWSWRRWVRSRG